MKYLKLFEAYFDEDKIPADLVNYVKDKLGYKRSKLLGCGRYGCAFKVKGNKVLKITTDLKEYEYAKKIEGLNNKHIADIYDVYHTDYNGEKYAIIIKEYCGVSSEWMDRLIDSFLEYSYGNMSLSFISSEFLSNDVSINKLNDYFKEYKRNEGNYDLDDWYDMLMELKKHNIYVKDFNGDNIGMKDNINGRNSLCIIELGLGWWDNIRFPKSDLLY